MEHGTTYALVVMMQDNTLSSLQVQVALHNKQTHHVAVPQHSSPAVANPGNNSQLPATSKHHQQQPQPETEKMYPKKTAAQCWRQLPMLLLQHGSKLHRNLQGTQQHPPQSQQSPGRKAKQQQAADTALAMPAAAELLGTCATAGWACQQPDGLAQCVLQAGSWANTGMQGHCYKRISMKQQWALACVTWQ
jgi:hypothetical protein